MDQQAQTQQTPVISTSEPVNTPVQQPLQPKTSSRNKLLLAGFLVIILLVAGGTFVLSQKHSTSVTTSQTPTQQVAVKPGLTLTLDSPTQNTLVSNNTLEIKGKTLPNVPVVFYTDTDDGSIQSDAQGNFQGTLTLENGINTLTVTAYGDNDEEKSISMDVVYDEGATQ